MAIRFQANAAATCKGAGFHAVQFQDGNLVAWFFGRADYFCVLRPGGYGYICIGPDELLATPDLIYDVAGGGQAIRQFSSVKNFTTMAMRDVRAREERTARAAEKRALMGA